MHDSRQVGGLLARALLNQKIEGGQEPVLYRYNPAIPAEWEAVKDAETFRLSLELDGGKYVLELGQINASAVVGFRYVVEKATFLLDHTDHSWESKPKLDPTDLPKDYYIENGADGTLDPDKIEERDRHLNEAVLSVMKSVETEVNQSPLDR